MKNIDYKLFFFTILSAGKRETDFLLRFQIFMLSGYKPGSEKKISASA